MHPLARSRSRKEPYQISERYLYGASILHDLLWTWRKEFGSQAPAIPQLIVSLSTPSEHHSHSESLGQEKLSSSREYDSQNQATEYEAEIYSDVNLVPQTIPDTDWIWNIGFPTLPVGNSLYMGAFADVYEDNRGGQLN